MNFVVIQHIILLKTAYGDSWSFFKLKHKIISVSYLNLALLCLIFNSFFIFVAFYAVQTLI